MSFQNRYFAVLGAVLALAANACSATTARDARVVEGPLHCAGGVVRTDGDAARYSACTTVEGDLKIENSELTDLNAFESLRSVSGALVIANNPKLISLRGLNGVTRARSVQIRNNGLLCAQMGLMPQLGEVNEGLVVRSNRGLSKGDVRRLREHVKESLDLTAVASR